MKAERLVLIGLDCVPPEFVERFAHEGRLSCIAELIKDGVFMKAWPCPPCDTPTNWTTIMTGIWTGTHGITSFHIHDQGEPLNKGAVNSSHTSLCNAEFLWDVAERHGKKCLLFDYPGSWPPTVKNSIVIGGWGWRRTRGPGAGMPGVAPRIEEKTLFPEEVGVELERYLGPPMRPLRPRSEHEKKVDMVRVDAAQPPKYSELLRRRG